MMPSIYYAGTRKGQVLHARLRTNCCSLNDCLFCKNIVNNRFCTCGETEYADHFLFRYPQYEHYRAIMIEKILRFSDPSLNVLLYGEMSLNVYNI